MIVVGGANSAGQAAVHLATHAHHVTMLVRGESLPQRCRATSSTESRPSVRESRGRRRGAIVRGQVPGCGPVGWIALQLSYCTHTAMPVTRLSNRMFSHPACEPLPS